MNVEITQRDQIMAQAIVGAMQKSAADYPEPDFPVEEPQKPSLMGDVGIAGLGLVGGRLGYVGSEVGQTAAAAYKSPELRKALMDQIADLKKPSVTYAEVPKAAQAFRDTASAGITEHLKIPKWGQRSISGAAAGIPLGLMAYWLYKRHSAPKEVEASLKDKLDAGADKVEDVAHEVGEMADNAKDKTVTAAKTLGDKLHKGLDVVEQKASSKYRPILEKMKSMFEHNKETDAAPVKKAVADGKPEPKATDDKLQKQASIQKEAIKFTWKGGVRWPVAAALGAAVPTAAILAYPEYKKMKWGDVINQPSGSENWMRKVNDEYQTRAEGQSAKLDEYLRSHYTPDEFGGYTNSGTGTVVGAKAFNAKAGFLAAQAKAERDRWYQQQIRMMSRMSRNGHTVVPEQYQTGRDKAFEEFKTEYTKPLGEGVGAFLQHLVGNPGIYRGTPYLRGRNPQTMTEDQLRERFEGLMPATKQ